MPTFHPAVTPIYPRLRSVIVYFRDGIADGKNAYRIEPGILVDEERGIVVSSSGNSFYDTPCFYTDIPQPPSDPPVSD